MPEKNYRIYLDDENAIFVYVETVSGEVTSFVIKLLILIEGVEYEVLRYDSGHDMSHIDILDSEGETVQKIWLPYLDFGKALTHAKKDIKLNYQFYRERFIQWKNEKKDS